MGWYLIPILLLLNVLIYAIQAGLSKSPHWEQHVKPKFNLGNVFFFCIAIKIVTCIWGRLRSAAPSSELRAADTTHSRCADWGDALSFQKSHFKGCWQNIYSRAYLSAKLESVKSPRPSTVSAGSQSSRPTASEDLLYGSAATTQPLAAREPPADASELLYVPFGSAETQVILWPSVSGKASPAQWKCAEHVGLPWPSVFSY